MVLLQPLFQFAWELFVTHTTHRLQVELKELGLMAHLPVTNRASKMADTPRLVKGTEHVSRHHVVTDKTDIPKQLQNRDERNQISELSKQFHCMFGCIQNHLSKKL